MTPIKFTLFIIPAISFLLCNCARELSAENRNVEYSYAKAAAPYAAMSTLSYEEDQPKAKDKANVDYCQFYITKKGWRKEPRIRYDEECNAHGLQYCSWINESLKPAVLCIAFRGTEFTKLQDWRTNFRPLVHAFSGTDQYDLVPVKVGPAIEKYYGNRIRRGEVVVITTGHSLGGGLAQKLRYHFPAEIKQCYAFDPSPVTGFTWVSREEKKHFSAQMPIDGFPDAQTVRIHQKGEILQYVRNITHLFTYYSNQIDKIRFNVTDDSFILTGGSPANMHNMSMLAAGIIARSGESATLPQPTEANQAWWDKKH